MRALPFPARYVVAVFPSAVAYIVIACSSSGGNGPGETPVDGGLPPDSGGPMEGAPAVGDGDAGTPPPPNACSLHPTTNCTGNTVEYLCTGSATLMMNGCSGGITEPNGIGFCCSLPQAMSTCKADPAVSCAAAATGYSCTGSDSPAQSSSTLLCAAAMAGAGGTGYCCMPYASSTCQLTTILSSCGGKYGFACSGSEDPAQSQNVDGGLLVTRCDTGSTGLNNTTDYCCDISAPAAPATNPTCMLDPSVTCSPTTGYSCSGTDTPNQDYPGLSCGTPAAKGAKTAYCCRDN
jgi:hypothetical protein